MWPVGCPETSVKNHHYSLRNNTEDRSSLHDIRGLLEKYPTFGREKETGLLGALDT